MQARTALLSLTSVFAVAALAALVVRLWSDRAPKHEPIGLDSLRAELRETRRDLASLNRAQVLLASQRLSEGGPPAQGALTLGPDRAANDAGLAAPTENGSPPIEMDEDALQQAVAEEEAATVVRYDKLASDLESEPRDSAWANEIERAYRNQVETFEGSVRGAKPTIVSLQCRTTLCRMELAFSNEEDARRYGARLSQHPSIKRGTVRQISTAGEVRTVAFLARGDRTIYPLRPNQTPLGEH